MIKTWTSPIQTSCRALMMRSTIFLFLYSPGPSHVLLLHAHWRERGEIELRALGIGVFMCVCARAHFIGMQIKCGLVERDLHHK